MRQIWIVFTKEIVDNLRDRRTLVSSLAVILGIPIALIGLISFMVKNQEAKLEGDVKLAVSGAEHAPYFVEFIERNDISIIPFQGDGRGAVERREHDTVLIIPDSFAETFLKGKPSPLEIIFDASRSDSRLAASRVENVIDSFSATIASLRMTNAGLDQGFARPVYGVLKDISPNQQKGLALILSLLPIIMLSAAFTGGYYLAIDVTAGEKERDTLEPLLTLPVPVPQIVLGKFLAIAFFALIALFAVTLLTTAITNVPFIRELTSLSITFEIPLVLFAIAVIVPVVFFAAAVEMLIGSLTRSVKEAQVYLQIVNLLGFFPPYLAAVLDMDSTPILSRIPVMGQFYVIQKASRGDFLPWQEAIAPSTITLVIVAAAVAYVMERYKKERILL